MCCRLSFLCFSVNEKSNRPKLKDEVHRLNGISRNGQPLKKLQERDIYYVEDFLKAINKDKENIRNVKTLSLSPLGHFYCKLIIFYLKTMS